MIYAKGNGIEQMARKDARKETAVQDWKNRMLAAKKDLPKGIGQQKVIEKVIDLDPDLDSLAFSTRWRNAWFVKVSDPHITQLVEQSVVFFQQEAKTSDARLRRQNLRKPSK